MHRFGRPVRRIGEALAHRCERRDCGIGEVFGDLRVVVIAQRLKPDSRARRHFLQRLHAIAQRDHHIHCGRTGSEVVAGGAQMPIQVRGHFIGRIVLQILLVEPAQFFDVEACGRLIHVLDLEQRHEFLARKDFLITVRPAQPRQIVQHCVRQETIIAILHHPDRAMPLGQLAAVGAEDHRQVRERRHRRAERFVDIDLARRVVDVVVATNHLGDAHVDIVDHHCEIVGREAVGTDQHQIVELGIAPLDPALDQILEHHTAVRWILETQHAVRILAQRIVTLAVMTVVTRLLVAGHRRRAHRFEFLTGFVGVIRLARSE